MIAEQFIEAQIFLPFPDFLPDMDTKIHNISELLGKLRMTDNVACAFDRTNASSVDGIAEAWLLKHVISEYDQAPH